jgi:hypothetical protein
MLLAFHNDIVLGACCVWLIATQLRYYIDTGGISFLVENYSRYRLSLSAST